MIISYIDCYKNKVVRAEMNSEEIEGIDELYWCCNYYDDITKKHIDFLENVHERSVYVSDIQEDFNKLFFERHKEYRRK